MSKKPLNEFAPPSVDGQTDLLPPGEVDNEGAMAKADLYKLANYSVKLFKKIEDEDQLESWVQAKITKAADYIASVYHYLEYELKFNEYGAKLENSDVYSESEKKELKNRLNEAKEMLRTLKLAQAQKLEEAKSPKADKDYDGDGEIESDKDEVWGSRMKAAKKAGKMKESSDDWRDGDDDFHNHLQDLSEPSEEEIRPLALKLAKGEISYDEFKKRAEGMHYADYSMRRGEMGMYEEWDNDDEDPDVKKADSELKKRGVKLPKTKADPDKDMSKLAKKSKKDDDLDETYGQGVYESWDDDDEDPDVKKADSELKKRGVKLPKVKDKEVPIKKTAKDKEEEKLDELSHATLKSYADKKGDQMFKDKKPTSFKDLDNYRKAIDKMHKKEDDGLNETSEEKKKAYRDAAGKDMQKAAKADDKDKVSKRLKGVSASLKEDEKPSAGLSKKEKSSVVKKAKAGGDIGKPGKGFAKVEKAAKKSGAKDPKAVAAAAMWKNIKRESIAETEEKSDKDYDGDGKKESKRAEYLGSKDKAIKAAKEKESVKESVDLSRLKEVLTRLNG